jgi:hypothetical protein
LIRRGCGSEHRRGVDPKSECPKEETDVDPERREGEQAEDKEGREYGPWRKERE